MPNENRAGKERSPLGEDAAELSLLRHVELEDAIARRTSRPLRAVLFTGTAIILVLALIPTWHYLATMRATPSSAGSQGTAVEVASNVTTGSVSLNGRAAGTHLPALIYLRAGQNTITLDAPPFRVQTCRITAPTGAANDTCTGLGIVPPLQGDQRFYRVDQHDFVSAYVVAFSLGLTDLPAEQQAPALAALTDMLDQQLAAMSVVVPAGDHYARALAADGSPVVAMSAQALTATPVAQLSRLAGAYGCTVTVCPYIAETTFSDGPIVTSEPEWTVWLGASLGWRFSDPTGREVGNILIRAGLVGPTLAMTLAFSAEGAWHTPSSGALARELRSEVALDLCIDGANVFSTGASGAQQGVILIGEQGGASLEGCALTMRIVPDDPGRATPSVICRFGSLLATDTATAKLLPGLPLASPDEIAAIGT